MATRIIEMADFSLRNQYVESAVMDWVFDAFEAPYHHLLAVLATRNASRPAVLRDDYLAGPSSSVFGLSLDVSDATAYVRALRRKHLTSAQELRKTFPTPAVTGDGLRGPKARQNVAVVSGTDCVHGVYKLGEISVTTHPRDANGNPMVFITIAAKCCGDNLCAAGAKLHHSIVCSEAAQDPQGQCTGGIAHNGGQKNACKPKTYIRGKPSAEQYRCAGHTHLLNSGSPVLVAGATGIKAPF